MTQTAKNASIDWWLVTRKFSGEVATSAAFDAILASEARLQGLGRRDTRLAFRWIVEGTWWVAALDEQLRSRLKTHRPQLAAAYSAARDRDEDGKYIQAFLWARNRHAHQLPFTTAHDDGLAERRGGVSSKFSEELKWIPISRLPIGRQAIPRSSAPSHLRPTVGERANQLDDIGSSRVWPREVSDGRELPAI
jgi:hypothetical protein